MLPNDERRLECVVDGLPLPTGGQVAVDCTLVSALSGKGQARPRAHWEEGAALADSRKRKQVRYPELHRAGTRCPLVFAGMETAGRWAPEAYTFLYTLAAARSRRMPLAVRGSAYRAWLRRWTAFLAVAGLRAYADSLLHGSSRTTPALEGALPTLGQLLGDEPFVEPPEVSRLPLRT